MAFKDLCHNFDYGLSIIGADITATTTGEAIDLTGITDVMVLISVGNVAIADASNLFTFTVTECATAAGTYVAADASQYDTSDSWDRIINATTEEETIYAFNFFPTSRYMRVVATETGTFNGIIGAVVLKYGRHEPESA